MRCVQRTLTHERIKVKLKGLTPVEYRN
ncbi:IS3 family transposase [Acinetobacter soli]